ncbi:MAG: penicillin-binding protein 1A, partial [Acetobacteraceae bacterium]
RWLARQNAHILVAMPVPLKAGDKLLPEDPRRRGRRTASPTGKRWRSGWIRRIVGGLFGLITAATVVGVVGGWVAWQRFSADLPSVEGLRGYQPPVMSRMYAGDGRLIAEMASQRRIFVPYAAIPDLLKAAFISAEDQNFWRYPGIDPAAIIRAGAYDLTHMGSGRRPLGASTITQQVAKNMLLGDRMSLTRKIEEAILAIRMQQVLSKERILEIYLNEIYLGQQSYGVAAAAQTYFNKPLDQLSLAEDATLAALPKAPSNYNPFRFPAAANARRDWVLDRMVEDGAITGKQAAVARAESLVPTEFHKPAPIPGVDWFADEARRELTAQFGENMLLEGGLTVRTSIDPDIQTVADRSVRDGLMAYDRKMGGWRGPIAHLDEAGKGQDWAAALATVAKPPGMLPQWRLAAVLGIASTEARVEWLDPSGRADGPPTPRSGVLRLGEETWHHPMTPDGKQSAAYRSLSEMLRPGDVVLVQPEGTAGGGPERVLLRQIPKVQGALVCLDPSTGRVLAMVGGWSYDASQFNRATQALRQPGSSFKPIVYLTALEKGISPSDRFLNAPIVISTGGGVWRPHNYEQTFGGPTSLRVALEQSLNLVTIRVARRVGMTAVAETAENFGMVDNMPKVLPAALGAVDTTVLREAGAYASIDQGGRRVVPTLIDSVQDPQGHVVWRPAGHDCACDDAEKMPDLRDNRRQIADPQSVFQLVMMMEGVIQRGTGVTAGAGLHRPLAGKTGTTQDFTDAWFAGFSPGLVTVVWVGFDNPSTLGDNETGSAVAAPIWHDFMAAALTGRPVLSFPQPTGVTMASWNSGSGVVTDAFKPGQVPGASSAVGGESVAGGPGGPTDRESASSVSGSGGVDSSLGGLY